MFHTILGTFQILAPLQKKKKTFLHISLQALHPAVGEARRNTMLPSIPDFAWPSAASERQIIWHWHQHTASVSLSVHSFPFVGTKSCVFGLFFLDSRFFIFHICARPSKNEPPPKVTSAFALCERTRALFHFEHKFNATQT